MTPDERAVVEFVHDAVACTCYHPDLMEWDVQPCPHCVLTELLEKP